MNRKLRERGSSLPEMVIVMTVLLALMFGIIDFGRAMYTYSFVAQLARQGARWAIVRGSNCSLLDHCPNAQSSDVQTYVQSLNYGAAVTSSISVAAVWTPPSPSTCPTVHAPGCVVTVTVTYPFKFFLPWVLPGNVWTLSSASQMVVSN